MKQHSLRGETVLQRDNNDALAHEILYLRFRYIRIVPHGETSSMQHDCDDCNNQHYHADSD